MSTCLGFRGFSLIGENISTLCYINFVFIGDKGQHLLLCSNEDVDEGFVINQEGIGLRLTAMEYWKCSKAGITLPSLNNKEPDCKFVIAESLPEQGTGLMLKQQFLMQLQQPHYSVCRQKSGGHLLGEAQSPGNSAHRAVHKRHSFYLTYYG